DRYQNVYEVLYDLENIYEFNSMYRAHKNKEKIKNIVKVCMLAISFIAIIGGLKLMDIEKNEIYDDLVDKGFNELKVYNFDSAMNYFEDANELIKRRIDSYLGIGQTYLNQGDYEICINYLDDIEAKVKGSNENPQFHYLRGTAYYEIKNYEKAIMDFHKATEYDVDKVEYQRDLAVCYAKTDRIEKAKDVIDEIILFKEYDDVVYYVNGEIEYQLGNIDEAIYNFQSAIDIADEDEVKRKAYLSLSDIYKENRNNSTNALNEQIYILERALGDLQFKDDFVITEYLAEAYFDANRYDESSEKFNKLLSLGYDRPYIYSNLAIIYQQMGNLSQAENILLEMKVKYPNDYKCYVQLAYVYLEQEGMKSEYSRDYSEVLQNYELAKQFSPSGVDNSEVMQLNNKISELRQKGWL
ncbi:MAG: tetratricopeptide repeat protein, partial [Peptostreptococcaceae bacterium]